MLHGSDSSNIQESALFKNMLRCDRQYQDFVVNIEKLYDNKNYDNILITGNMGSGKSKGACYAAHFHMLVHNAVPIMVLAKSGDIPDMETTIRNYNKDIEKYNKIRRDMPDIRQLNYVRASSLRLNKDNEIEDPQNISDLFCPDKNNNTVILCLGHQDQMYKTLRLLVENYHYMEDCRSYVTIFDETHKKLAPKENDCVIDWEEVLDNDSWPTKITLYEAIHSFCIYSIKNYLVTATPVQNLISNTFPLKAILCVGKLQNSELTYVSFRQARYFYIDEIDKNATPVDDSEWREILKKWSERGAMDGGFGRSWQAWYFIDLSSPFHEDHIAKRDYVLQHYPDKFTLVVNNCNGYEITFNSRTANLIRNQGGQIKVIDSELKERNFTMTEENSILINPNFPYARVIQMIRDLGKSVTRLMVFAGNRLAEGTRCNSYDHTMTPTDLFFRRKGMAWDLQAQMTARVLCGYMSGSLLRHAYCTKRTQQELIYGDAFNHAFIEHIRMELEFKRMSIYQLVQTFNIDEERLSCIRRMCKKKLDGVVSCRRISQDLNDRLDSLGASGIDIKECRRHIRETEMIESKQRREMKRRKRRRLQEKSKEKEEKEYKDYKDGKIGDGYYYHIDDNKINGTMEKFIIKKLIEECIKIGFDKTIPRTTLVLKILRNHENLTAPQINGHLSNIAKKFPPIPHRNGQGLVMWISNNRWYVCLND